MPNFDERNRSSDRAHYILSVWLAVGTIFSGVADADLTPQDEQDLTFHLNVIAQDPGWPQASVDAANGILSKPEYDSVCWEGYFTDYFSAQPFNERLFNYLQYPVFYWFDEPTHVRLQQGLAAPLMDGKMVPTWTAAINDGGDIFAVNAQLREELFVTQNMLIMMGSHETLSAVPETRDFIYSGVIDLVNQFPATLRKSATVDRTNQPYFGALRFQAFMVMLGAADSTDTIFPMFSPTVIGEIASALDLTGVFADLWNDHTLLLLENNLSSVQQQQQVYDYLALVPSTMHNAASVTIDEFLGNSTTFQSERIFSRRPYDGVNIFEVEVGALIENSFPDDVKPGLVDIFTAALAHEINHVVDVITLQGDGTLAARRQALLDSAGCNAQNYLRSMFPDCTFQNAPQEFIASIANQWFTDSGKTMELGLTRFDAGRLDPINQALFFVEMYSLGGDMSLFYHTDALGNMLRWTVPLTRNLNGHIDSFVFDGDRYEFTLDASGDLVAYEISPNPLCDFDGDSICDISDLNALLAEGPVAGGVSASANKQFDLTNDGVIDLADRDAWLAAAAAEAGLGSPYQLGDGNLDGVVDVKDFNLWNANKFISSLLWSDGNFTGDAVVDASDFNVWNAHKFTVSDGVTAVPEPGAVLLWLVALALLSAVQWRG